MDSFSLKAQSDRRRDGLNRFWLSVDNAPVAFMKACYESVVGDDEKQLMLYDIEVREGYRGKGYSKAIMSLACEMFGVDRVTHSGGYTELGYQRIFHNVDYVANKYAPMETDYPPTTFVLDWDNLIHNG